MRKTPSSILGMAVLGLAALALTACDRGHHKRAPVAKTECCCDKTCPTPSPTRTADGGATTSQAGGQVGAGAGGTAIVTTGQSGYGAKASGGNRRYGRTTAYAKSHTYADRGARSERGYGRTGTEGVGYLDEAEDAGAYRRAEVRTTYSERRTSSQSGYAYGAAYGSQSGYASESYVSGGEYRTESRYSSGQGDPQGGRYRRKRDRSYVGTDRYGYLTWPGKTR